MGRHELDCETARSWLDDRLDGLLDADDAPVLDAHLAACPGCREIAAQLEALVGELDDLAAATAHVGRAERGQVEPRVVPTRHTHRPRRALRIATSVLAAAAVLITAFLLSDWTASPVAEPVRIANGGKATDVDDPVVPSVPSPTPVLLASYVQPTAEMADRFVAVERVTSVPKVHLIELLPFRP